jgi:prepilin-type N-terminal cleavage/methylation domain-containing protein
MIFRKRLWMRCRISRGFTLVEVMVSLVIMLMVVTVAFSGFRIGINAWERGGRAVDAMDKRATLERLIQRQLASAYPLQVSMEKDTVVLFRGSASRIDFVSDYSLADGSVDFRKISYVLDNGRFLYGEQSLFGYVPSESEPLPETVLVMLPEGSFQFLGRDKDDKPIWTSEWKLGDGMPLAIKLELATDTFVVPLVNRDAK